MTEKQNLLIESAPNKFSSGGWVGSFGIPGLKRMFAPQPSFLHEDKRTLQKDMLKRKNSHTSDVDIVVITRERESYHALSPTTEASPRFESPPKINVTEMIGRGFTGAPALVIAILLNLFFGVSFGQVFFPTSWDFPDTVPRAIGVQMFLMSTVICQIVMTLTSSFPMAFGMMMVENVPFMHVICTICIDAQGMGKETFATVFVAFAISTISVGVFFYLLGHFKMGNAVYFFPKHVIVGCIGGIGVFLFTTGMEGSTNIAWKWDLDVISRFFSSAVLPLWMTSLSFEILLRFLQTKTKDPLLVPFFFVSIPFVFYAVLLIFGIPIERAHEMGWFFQGVKGDVNPLLIWELIDYRNINWGSILRCGPTIVALTIFSLMHVPINIPSLSISTGYPTDMNNELKAHGISNILSGMCGGLQNYVCYCNSVTYFKCNGGGVVSGLLLALSCSVFFFIGPSAVAFVPRCMAGCLLMHIGSDLSKEALWDSIGAFDVFEYGSVIAITIVMTAYGMTAGLALGVFCAALTFTLQSTRNIPPIRAVRSARTLRSSTWRSQEMNDVLDENSSKICVIQLQGHLFFGNATLLSAKVESMLLKSKDTKDIEFLVLDFTLVLAIDASAAETVAKIFEICEKYKVRLCYSRASPKGFPCVAKLSDKLKSLVRNQDDAESKHSSSGRSSGSTSGKEEYRENKEGNYVKIGKEGNGGNGGREGKEGYGRDDRKKKNSRSTSNLYGERKSSFDNEDSVIETPPYNVIDVESGIQSDKSIIDDSVFVADSLDEGLAWCEDILISEHLPSSDIKDPYSQTTLECGKPVPAYLRQLHVLCPYESSEVVSKLFTKFKKEHVKGGTILWKQGEASTRAVLLCRGKLLSILKEEGEHLVTEDICVGHLVGEYGLINNTVRQGTLTAIEDSELYVLSKSSFEEMMKNEPYLAFALSRICLAYLGHRVMHVSNRIWYGQNAKTVNIQIL